MIVIRCSAMGHFQCFSLVFLFIMGRSLTNIQICRGFHWPFSKFMRLWHMTPSISITNYCTETILTIRMVFSGHVKIIQRFDGKEQWHFHVTDGRFHLSAVSRGGSIVECSVNEYSDNAKQIFASNEAYDAHLGERNNYFDKHKEPPLPRTQPECVFEIL